MAIPAAAQTPFGTTLDFLRHVLPPEPICYIAWVYEGRFRHSHFTGALDQAVNRGRWLAQQGHNTYFALAGFKQATHLNKFGKPSAYRQQENVKSIRTLILDVDNKDYGSLVETLTAFQAAYAKSNMPPPSYIVDSGGGIHVYWLLEEPMDEPEHRKRSLLLANLFKGLGLVADYQCTKDSARVLRLPGTFNFKYDPPTEVRLLTPFQGYTDPVRLDEVLGTAAASNVVALQFDPNMRSAMALDIGNQTLMGSHKKVESSFAKIIENCPTVAASIATAGANDGYPLWKNLLHLAAFTEDGHDFIHQFSSGHPGYTYEGTVDKFEESVQARTDRGAQVGPTTCNSFNEDSPACRACQWWGKIKSPFSLGIPTPVESAAKADDPTYVRNGATYRKISVADEDDPTSMLEIEQRVADFEMTNFVVARFGLLKETLLTFTIKEQDHTFQITIPTPDISDTKSPALSRELALRSIMMAPKEVLAFRGVLMAWVNTLRAREAAGGGNQLDTSGYGWCQQGNDLVSAFAYCGTVYHQDGRTVPGVPHEAMADAYTPMGTLGPWRAAAEALCADERMPIHAVLAAAFAAPLMRYFPDTPSFTLSLVSSASGVGKSTALRVAAAVWGEPTRSMRQLNDTPNALLRHMALARDMPAYWDDIRGERRVDGFLEVMFQLTQGREKERLTRSAKTSPAGILRTILTVASNSSVLDRVSDRDRTSDATARRVLEFRLGPLGTATMDQAQREIFHAVKSNYGHAGDMIARWLPQNEAKVLAWRDQLLGFLQKQVGATNEDRFWVDACCAILIGGLIAKEMGLAPIRVQALGTFLIEHLKSQKVAVVEGVQLAAEELLQSILFANQDYILRCEDTGQPLPTKSGKVKLSGNRVVEAAPRRSTVAVEINRLPREVVITHSAVEHFLATRRNSQHTAGSVYTALEERYKVTRERRTPGKGTPYTSGQAMCRVIRFPTDEAFAEVLPPAKEAEDA